LKLASEKSFEIVSPSAPRKIKHDALEVSAERDSQMNRRQIAIQRKVDLQSNSPQIQIKTGRNAPRLPRINKEQKLPFLIREQRNATEN